MLTILEQLDEPLLPTGSALTQPLLRRFGAVEDHLELAVYDPSGQFLLAENPYLSYRPAPGYRVSESGNLEALEVDPEADLIRLGRPAGDYQLVYRVMRSYAAAGDWLLLSPAGDGKTAELRPAGRQLTYDALLTEAARLEAARTADGLAHALLLYWDDPRPEGVRITGITTTGAGLLLTLAEALPARPARPVRLVEELVAPRRLRVRFEPEAPVVEKRRLLGPRIDPLAISQQTPGGPGGFETYEDWQTLAEADREFGLAQPELRPADAGWVDYADFSQFVHFGSAGSRLQGFLTKLAYLEAASGSANPTVRRTADGLVAGMDAYEQWLYESTDAASYPKTASGRPRPLASASAWIGSYDEIELSGSGKLGEAGEFDRLNPASLWHMTARYVRENPANQPLHRLMDLTGNFFDQYWLRTRALPGRYRSFHSRSDGPSPVAQKAVLSAYFPNLPQDLPAHVLTRLWHNLPYLRAAKGSAGYYRVLGNLLGLPPHHWRLHTPSAMVPPPIGQPTAVGEDEKPDYQGFGLLVSQSASMWVKLDPAHTGSAAPSTVELRVQPAPGYSSASSQPLVEFIRGHNPSGSVTSFRLDRLADGRLQWLQRSGSGAYSALRTTVNNRLPLDGQSWLQVALIRNSGSAVSYTTWLTLAREGESIFSEMLNLTGATADPLATGSMVLLTGSAPVLAQEVRQWSGRINDSRHFRMAALHPWGLGALSQHALLRREPLGSTGRPGFWGATATEGTLRYEPVWMRVALLGGPLGLRQRRTRGVRVDVAEAPNFRGTPLAKRPLSPFQSLIDYPLSPRGGGEETVFARSLTDNTDDDLLLNGEPFSVETALADPRSRFRPAYDELVALRRQRPHRSSSAEPPYAESGWARQLAETPARQVGTVGTLLRPTVLDFQPVQLRPLQATVAPEAVARLLAARLRAESSRPVLIAPRMPTLPSVIRGLPVQIREQRRHPVALDRWGQPAEWNEAEGTFLGELEHRVLGSRLSASAVNEPSELQVGGDRLPTVGRWARQIALFSGLSPLPYRPGTAEVQLKYLVDDAGQLADLNRLNRRWFDLQHLFVAGDPATLTLFNTKGLATIPGQRLVIDSGYRERAMLYWRASERVFRFTGEDPATKYTVRAVEKADRQLPDQPEQTVIFPTVLVNEEDVFTPGTYEPNPQFPKYAVPRTGQYQLSAEVKLEFATDEPKVELGYRLAFYRGSIAPANLLDSTEVVFQPMLKQYLSPEIAAIEGKTPGPVFFEKLPTENKMLEGPLILQQDAPKFNRSHSEYWGKDRTSAGFTPVPYNAATTWSVDRTVISAGRRYTILRSSTGYLTPPLLNASYQAEADRPVLTWDENAPKLIDTVAYTMRLRATMGLPYQSFEAGPNGLMPIEQNFRQPGQYRVFNFEKKSGLRQGETVLVVLERTKYTNVTPGTTVKILAGSSLLIEQQNAALTTDNGLLVDIAGTSVRLDGGLVPYQRSGTYQFNPSGSALEADYGPIDTVFHVKPGDRLILREAVNRRRYERTIVAVRPAGADDEAGRNGTLELTLDAPLGGNLTPTTVDEVLLIQREADETTLTLQLSVPTVTVTVPARVAPGETVEPSGSAVTTRTEPAKVGYGLLLPRQLAPRYLDAMDTVIGQIKQKLIQDQSIDITK